MRRPAELSWQSRTSPHLDQGLLLLLLRGVQLPRAPPDVDMGLRAPQHVGRGGLPRRRHAFVVLLRVEERVAACVWRRLRCLAHCSWCSWNGDHECLTASNRRPHLQRIRRIVRAFFSALLSCCRRHRHSGRALRFLGESWRARNSGAPGWRGPTSVAAAACRSRTRTVGMPRSRSSPPCGPSRAHRHTTALAAQGEVRRPHSLEKRVSLSDVHPALRPRIHSLLISPLRA